MRHGLRARHARTRTHARAFPDAPATCKVATSPPRCRHLAGLSRGCRLPSMREKELQPSKWSAAIPNPVHRRPVLRHPVADERPCAAPCCSRRLLRRARLDHRVARSVNVLVLTSTSPIAMGRTMVGPLQYAMRIRISLRRCQSSRPTHRVPTVSSRSVSWHHSPVCGNPGDVVAGPVAHR